MFELAKFVTLFGAMWWVMQFGLAVSGAGLIGCRLSAILCRHTERVEQPDPTVNFRRWRRLITRSFHPFGMLPVDQDRDMIANRRLYELAVGVVVIAVCMSLYLIAGTTTIGAAAVSYYTAGYMPDLTFAIETYAAAVTLFGLAVISYVHNHSAEFIRNEALV